MLLQYEEASGAPAIACRVSILLGDVHSLSDVAGPTCPVVSLQGGGGEAAVECIVKPRWRPEDGERAIVPRFEEQSWVNGKLCLSGVFR